MAWIRVCMNHSEYERARGARGGGGCEASAWPGGRATEISRGWCWAAAGKVGQRGGGCDNTSDAGAAASDRPSAHTSRQQCSIPPHLPPRRRRLGPLRLQSRRLKLLLQRLHLPLRIPPSRHRPHSRAAAGQRQAVRPCTWAAHSPCQRPFSPSLPRSLAPSLPRSLATSKSLAPSLSRQARARVQEPAQHTAKRRHGRADRGGAKVGGMVCVARWSVEKSE